MNNGFSSGNKHSLGTLIKKAVLCHFGAAMLGIMISIPTADPESPNVYLNIITASFAVLFYLYILYTTVWDFAAKDKLCIDGGRMKADKLKGLKAALLANLPTLTLTGVAVFASTVTKFTGALWAADTARICMIINRFWNSMYIGYVDIIDGHIGLLALYIIFFLITIPGIVTCLLAYRAGIAGIRIFPEMKKKK